MNAKRISLIAGAVGAIAVAGLISANSVSAYQGDYTKKGPNYSEARHEAMEKAFEENDYAAWKEQMQGRGRVTQVVTEENFAKFAQAHQLAEEGKYAEADAIRKELGLRTSDGQKTGAGYGKGQGRNRQAQ